MKVIPATESHKLHPEQWVNIYQLILTGGAEFYDCSQVADLDLDEQSEYALELIDEGGKVISLGEAMK